MPQCVPRASSKMGLEAQLEALAPYLPPLTLLPGTLYREEALETEKI